MSKRRNQTEMENESTYMMYYNRLRDYALSMFEWTGLPDSVNERFLEVRMFHDGKIGFFEDKSMGFLTLPVALKGLNVYNEPTEVNAYSTNYQKTLKMDDCVIIWNNISRTPIEPIVMEFAKRLYHVERALDINIKQQKFPYFILSDETQRLTFQNAMEQYDGNEMFIFGNKKGFDKEAFQVLNTPVPFVADKLWEYKHNLWNEAMTFLGIGNAQQQKKERMVTDEVSANDEQIMSSRFVMLHERQKACEKINEKFGLDIWVDFKLNVQQEEQEMEGDGENEES